ncbi:unnamed protein product, partial [Brachionus calyciflorus]
KIEATRYTIKYIRNYGITVVNNSDSLGLLRVKNNYECFNSCSKNDLCELVEINNGLCKLLSFNSTIYSENSNSFIYIKHFNPRKWIKKSLTTQYLVELSTRGDWNEIHDSQVHSTFQILDLRSSEKDVYLNKLDGALIRLTNDSLYVHDRFTVNGYWEA